MKRLFLEKVLILQPAIFTKNGLDLTVKLQHFLKTF